MNNYFASVGKLRKNPENSKLLQHIYRRLLLSSIPLTTIQTNLPKCCKQVFKPGKAGGHDEITSKEALLIGEEVLTGLHYIAKSSFSSQKCPTRYKIAKVRCIHKKSSRVKCKNYRPISLLSLLEKLLEAIIASELDNHVFQHNLLSDYQWGFRKNRSPELLLLNITEDWLNLLKKGEIVGVILIDFSKTFDSVCHTTLKRNYKPCA